MNFYTLAAREERKSTRLREERRTLGYTDAEARDWVEQHLDLEFDKTYRRAVRRMLIAKQINEEMGLIEHKERFFMITIRPDTNKINFNDFYSLVYKYISRKCFVSYTLSFEQKGISTDTLGHGFHVHIIADLTQKGKAMVLRDTQSTFNRCTAANCIQVDWCRNPKETIQGYLIDYKSSDNHKQETKHWDQIWRERENLLSIYDNNLPQERAYQVRSGTQIIELS